MIIRKTLAVTALAIILMLAAGNYLTSAQDQTELPERINYVSDHADLYSDQHEQELNEVFQVMDESEQLEIDLLTVESIGEMSIEGFSAAVNEEWGTSQNQNERRHLLVVIAVEDGMYNLVTTNGLERYVSDSELSRINADVIVPALEERSIEAAIVEGIQAIIDSYLTAKLNESPIHTASGASGMSFEDFFGIILVVAALGILMLINSLY